MAVTLELAQVSKIFQKDRDLVRAVDAVSLSVRGLLAELAVAPLPVVHDPSTGMPPPAYTQSLVARVREQQVSRQIADGMATMRRLGADPQADQGALRELSLRLQSLERERAAIRDGISR